MKIKITNEDNQIITRLITGEGIKDFDYIKVINALYEKESIDFEYENIDQEQQEKIEKIFKEICSTITDTGNE